MLLAADPGAAPLHWFHLLIQAGGAVCVCGMFLFFLHNQETKREEREASRETERKERDAEKEKRFFAQLDKQTAYLKDRDAQSKEIALNGHDALRDVASGLSGLREEMAAATAKCAQRIA